MPSPCEPHELVFPLETELRCGTCFRKLGVADLVRLDGRIEILCTRRSRQRTCRTLNVYESTADGSLRHSYHQLELGDTSD